MKCHLCDTEMKSDTGHMDYDTGKLTVKCFLHQFDPAHGIFVFDMDYIETYDGLGACKPPGTKEHPIPFLPHPPGSGETGQALRKKRWGPNQPGCEDDWKHT